MKELNLRELINRAAVRVEESPIYSKLDCSWYDCHEVEITDESVYRYLYRVLPENTIANDNDYGNLFYVLSSLIARGEMKATMLDVIDLAEDFFIKRFIYKPKNEDVFSERECFFGDWNTFTESDYRALIVDNLYCLSKPLLKAVRTQANREKRKLGAFSAYSVYLVMLNHLCDLGDTRLERISLPTLDEKPSKYKATVTLPNGDVVECANQYEIGELVGLTGERIRQLMVKGRTEIRGCKISR